MSGAPPRRFYEAAEVDGAGRLHRFRAITLLMISPVLWARDTIRTAYRAYAGVLVRTT